MREAIEAGALGFSTSRTLGHRAMDGEPVPGTFAAEDELFGLGRAMAAGGQAVFELAPQGVAGEDIIAPKKELEWMQRLGAEIDRPISFGLIQVDAAPDLWREQMDISAAAHAAGSRLYPQIAARPFGMLFGFPGHHAFTHRPTFRRLKAELGREELAHRLADPAVKAAILGEDDLPPDPNKLFDNMNILVQYALGRIYHLGDPPDYEPTDDRTVEKIAANRGEDPLATLYDLMLEADATNMLMLPFFNYSYGNCDAIAEMLTHPAGVLGTVRRRRPLRNDLRRFVSHVPADPLGPRPSPRREAAAGAPDPQADARHGAAVRARRPGCHRGGQEGRRQRHRHGRAAPAPAEDGLRLACRRKPAGAGRVRLRRHDRQRRRHPPRRRRHRGAARSVGPRGAVGVSRPLVRPHLSSPGEAAGR